MMRIFRYLAIVLVLAIVGGAVFLATWRIPAPTTRIEKVIPNDRFPR